MRCCLSLICAGWMLALTGCGDNYMVANKNEAGDAQPAASKHDAKDMAAGEDSSRTLDLERPDTMPAWAMRTRLRTFQAIWSKSSIG